MNELDGPAGNTQNVEVTMHVSAGSHEDLGVGGAVSVSEGGFAQGTRSTTSDDDDDCAKYAVVIKATTYATGDDNPLKFAQFDVVQSPTDHHYLDTMEQVRRLIRHEMLLSFSPSTFQYAWLIYPLF